MLFPKKTKYKKIFKGKLKGNSIRGCKIIYGKYALKIIEETRLNNYQIEAAQKIILKKIKKFGVLYTRIFPDTPITNKPNENRMGKGKGLVTHWISKVKKGQIIFEISSNIITFENIKKILLLSSKKLPIKTKFIYK